MLQVYLYYYKDELHTVGALFLEKLQFTKYAPANEYTSQHVVIYTR